MMSLSIWDTTKESIGGGGTNRADVVGTLSENLAHGIVDSSWSQIGFGAQVEESFERVQWSI